MLKVLEAMKGSTSTRPAIFAMSNPTKNGNLSSFFAIKCVLRLFVILFWIDVIGTCVLNNS